jgi:DNA repair protein MmcB-like
VRYLTWWVTCRRLSARFWRLPLWLFFIFGRWIFADCGAPSALRNRRLALSFIHLRRDDIQPAGDYLLDTDEELIEGLSTRRNDTRQNHDRRSSVADFRADTKWRDYRAHCDRLLFAIPETVPIEIMPQDAGLILADSNGAEILREAPEHRMAAATRRAVLLRFAHAAAHRCIA